MASSILRSQTYQQSWKSSIYKEKNLNIYRYLDILSEICSDQAALIFNWRTAYKYPGTLKYYWLNNQKNDKILQGLTVKNRFISANNGIVENIIGYCDDEQKTKLLSYPDLHPATRKAIENSEVTDPILSVKTTYWGKDNFAHYVIDGLEISINEENAQKMGIDYEICRSKAKISLDEWKTLLAKAYQNSVEVLNKWGIELEQNPINSHNYSENFYLSPFNQQNVKLRFGKDVICARSEIKKGLKNGGVYRRYKNLSNPLEVIAIKLCKIPASDFLSNLESHLKILGFPLHFIERMPLEINNNMSEKDAVLIEKEIERAIALQPDLVITILPKGDKQLDKTEQGSYYYHVSQQLIPQGISSQMVTEENLNNNSILNNTVLGILTKLGNLPFILAEPIKVADYFIGLDVAHDRKSKSRGTKNACACVRMYGSSGEFINYKLADSKIDGEEIPVQVLRKLLPFEDLRRKRVLILRDGKFRGKEIENIQKRANQIDTEIIYVEITKTGTCRLFNQLISFNKETNDLELGGLQKPTQYLMFKHSDREVSIVTTKPLTGLTQPIRVKIMEGGIIPPLDDLIEAVIKLCLLHHGSYIEAGLPMPIYSSDKIGYKTLKGLYHLESEGEKQWWL